MIRALYTAATGMQAQQLNIDVIAHNLATVNTTGFKKSRAEFADLLYQSMRSAGFVVLHCEWWHFEFGTRRWAAITGNQPRYGPAHPPL